MRGADGMAGILDHLYAIGTGQAGNLGHVRRLAAQMHRHDDLRQPSGGGRGFQLVGQRAGAHRPSHRVDIDEIHRGAAVERAVGAGDKGVGHRPQHIARPQPQRHAGDVQGGGGRIHRHRMLGADMAGHRRFKPRDQRALRQEVRAQHGHDRGDILVRDVLAAIGDHVRSPRSWGGLRQSSLPAPAAPSSRGCCPRHR